MKYIPVRLDHSSQCFSLRCDPKEDDIQELIQADCEKLGYDTLADRFRGGTPCCATHLFMAVISGTLKCEGNDGEKLVEAGEFFVAPAGSQHWVTLASQSCEAVWFHLYQSPRWDHIYALKTDVHAIYNPAELKNAMVHFLDAKEGEAPFADELVGHYARILLILLDRELRTSHNPIKRKRMQNFSKLWQEIRKNPGYRWTVKELACRMGVAPEYLPGLCRHAFGVTPMQKVTQIRMDAACWLLISTDFSMANIASEVGYQSEYAFSNAFKRVTGRRPGAMRQSSKG